MTDTAYRLTIDPSLSVFEPEILYAFDFLDESYGLVRSVEAGRAVFYGPHRETAPDGALFVPAAMFPEGLRFDMEGIWPDETGLQRLENSQGPAPLLPAKGSGDGLGYDAPGLIFHQLSRVEERGSTDTDSYDRFPFGGTLAARQNRYGDPLADQAAADLARAITGDPAPLPSGDYAVLPTHDVDKLRGYNHVHEPLRYAAGDVLKRGTPRRALQRLYQAYFAGLPWSSLDEMMSLSERYGLQSHFYFIGPSHLAQDSSYGFTMPDLVRKTASKIRARGHVVGYHPGHKTCRDAEAWNQQKAALEAQVDGPLTVGRQHRLEYDFEVTPDIWDTAGMELDCTPAFPDATGFRTGTCRPHRAFSLRRRKALTLRLLSTPVQDFAYFSQGKYRDLTQDEALDEASRAIDTCKRYRGTLCVLQHLGQVTEPARGFYRRFLARCFDDRKAAA